MPETDRVASPVQDFGRDIRFDFYRGVALWFIFVDHLPNNIVSWLTLRHYGFSDAAEIFMFVSGVTCALAYRELQTRDGWAAVISHTLRRGWEIYAAFLLLTIACAIMVHVAGEGRFADDSNTRVLLDQPGVALAHAAILQYRPVNTDVLPTFVIFHALFAPLLFLLMRAPNLTLLASALLYVLVQIFGWNLPQWPRNDWYFNPLAWQFLVVLGAWFEMGGRQMLRPLLKSRATMVVALLYLLFSLVVVLGWTFKPMALLVPDPLARLIYPIDKPDLDPLRLLHFLCLAVLAVRWVAPDWRAFKNGILRGAIRCGENSLDVYCFGVLLALGGEMLLVRVSNAYVAQVAISVAGIAIMVGFATILTWVRIRTCEQPKLF